MKFKNFYKKYVYSIIALVFLVPVVIGIKLCVKEFGTGQFPFLSIWLSSFLIMIV